MNYDQLNVCVPVLKRYDLLAKLVDSLPKGVVLHIVNNGQNALQLNVSLGGRTADIYTPRVPMGVAESWNWFIEHVPEERVIANDDVVFAPDSLARLTVSDADLAWARGCGFSCFLLRDSCVKKIGVFDESISPGYGYYEDEDYLQRLDGKGTRAPSATAADVECGVVHLKSQTLAANTEVEMEEHHRKFHIARANYMTKWGIASL
jgi:GT2 family glycosyltransferase